MPVVVEVCGVNTSHTPYEEIDANQHTQCVKTRIDCVEHVARVLPRSPHAISPHNQGNSFLGTSLAQPPREALGGGLFSAVLVGDMCRQHRVVRHAHEALAAHLQKKRAGQMWSTNGKDTGQKTQRNKIRKKRTVRTRKRCHSSPQTSPLTGCLQSSTSGAFLSSYPPLSKPRT